MQFFESNRIQFLILKAYANRHFTTVILSIWIQFCVILVWHFRSHCIRSYNQSRTQNRCFQFHWNKMSFRLAAKATRNGFVWILLRSTYTTITTSRLVNFILPRRSFHVLTQSSGVSNCAVATATSRKIDQSNRRTLSTKITAENIPIATYDDIMDLPNHPKTLLVDVREPKELRETGEIPNCINIPRELQLLLVILLPNLIMSRTWIVETQQMTINPICSRRIDGSVGFERRKIRAEVWSTQANEIHENNILLSSWHSVWQSNGYRSGSRLHKVISVGGRKAMPVSSTMCCNQFRFPTNQNFHNRETRNEIKYFVSFQRQKLRRLLERIFTQIYNVLNTLFSNCWISKPEQYKWTK